MAVNKPAGDNARKGAVKKRTQRKTAVMGKPAWTKRDKTSGEFMAVKKSAKKFKGVRREKANRNWADLAGREMNRLRLAVCLTATLIALEFISLRRGVCAWWCGKHHELARVSASLARVPRLRALINRVRSLHHNHRRLRQAQKHCVADTGNKCAHLII